MEKVAVITGVSREMGLGYETAKQLNGLGYTVIITAIDSGESQLREPGFVATYQGTEAWGARPVTEGAKGIVWAATLDADGPSGGFFRDIELLEWLWKCTKE